MKSDQIDNITNECNIKSDMIGNDEIGPPGADVLFSKGTPYASYHGMI